MNHFELSWKTSDNLTVYAQGWEPDVQPFKAVVCLVHGIGEHSGRYNHVGKAFTNAKYVLFGFDLRGHGKSEGSRGHFPSAESVVRDIDLLLEHARLRYPGLPLILYGHSLGGILVLYYGLKQKPEVKGILATAPGLHNSLEKQPVKIFAAKLLGTIMPGLSMPTGLDVNALSQDKKVVEKYQNDPLIHARMSVGFGKIMLDIIKWTFDHAGEFSLPLFIIHGELDTIGYPSSSTDFASLVKENCQVVIWKDSFHELHNEPFKEEVFKTMIKWMDGLI